MISLRTGLSWQDLRDRERGGLNGWLEAGLFVVAISTLNIVYAVASDLNAHPLVFALYATAFAALGTLLLTGFGEDALAVIRAKQSWIFGAASIAMEAFYFLLLATVTPAEASLTVRLSVPASLFFGWIFVGRNVNASIIIGALVVIAAVVPILLNLNPALQLHATAFSLACAAIVSVKTFSSEFHPSNMAARTVGEKMRITGLVVLATAVIGLIACGALLVLELSGVVASGGIIPDVSDYLHIPTIGIAIILGAPILLIMNYLTFSSVIKIRTENFLASSAFAPLAALALQTMAAGIGLITVPAFDWNLVPLILLGIAGVLLVIRGGRRL